MRVHVGVQGTATAAVAWERYADPDAWSGWSPQIRRVDTGPEHYPGQDRSIDDELDEDADELDQLAHEQRSAATESASWAEASDTTPRRIVPGLRGVVIGPVGVQVPFEVLDVDEEAMTWTWRVHAVLAELTLEHSVAARAGGGCRTDLAVTGPALLVVGYAPLARLALTRLVRR